MDEWELWRSRRRVRALALLLATEVERGRRARAKEAADRRLKYPRAVWQHQYLARRNCEGVWWTLKRLLDTQAEEISQSLFKRFMRIDIPMFQDILREIRPDIEKKETNCR